MNGAQAILDVLTREGVEAIFGYPGGTIMPFYDALHGHPIRHYLVRHEAAAVFAASGYARTTGRVGVCCATSGPGATNLVTGLLDASMDSVPLVAITGQVRSVLMGTDGFQEADVCAITQTVTKRNFLVRDAADIVPTLEHAFALARAGRPGPVLVDIPTDILKATVPAIEHTSRSVGPEIPAHPRPEAVREAIAILRSARRPAVIVGGGVRKGDNAVRFRRFMERIGAPYVATINALGAETPGDPHYLGMVGMHGRKAANLAVHRADVLFALGMRFDDRVTGRTDRFARGAKVVHADIDASEFDKIIKADVHLHADLGATLDALCAELDATGAPPRYDDWAHEARLADGPLPADRAEDGHLSATTVLDRFMAMLPADAIVTTDVGQHQMWAAQRAYPRAPRNFATSAGLGSMGFGFPAAIGATVGNPGRPVFAVCGDGGFQMSIAELATVRRHGVPVKVLLIDNRNLGMVRQWQELFYGERYSATNLSDNPDFVAVAAAYGMPAECVSRADDLSAALARFITADGPMLLHAACFPSENVWPMIPAGMSIDELMEAKA